MSWNTEGAAPQKGGMYDDEHQGLRIITSLAKKAPPRSHNKEAEVLSVTQDGCSSESSSSSSSAGRDGLVIDDVLMTETTGISNDDDDDVFPIIDPLLLRQPASALKIDSKDAADEKKPCTAALTCNKVDADDDNGDKTTCPICLEDYDDYCDGDDDEEEYLGDIETGCADASRNNRMQLVDACGHSFCRNCLRQYCQYAISIHKVPIACPRNNNDSRQDACAAHISHETVYAVMFGRSDGEEEHNDDNAKDWEKFQKLMRLSNDPHLRECPGCEKLISIKSSANYYADNNNNNNNNNDDVQCPLCQHIFCLVHGNAHPDMMCSVYQLTPEARQLAQTEQTLSKYTKPCSHCGCRIQKSHGCDHVICGHCHEDMCFKCGTHAYLSGTMIRRCERCRRDYRDHRYDHIYRIRLVLFLPLLLPMIVLYVALAAVAAVVTGCFGGCFRCGRCFDSKTSTTTSNSSSNNNNGESTTTITTSNNDEIKEKRGTARHGVCASAIVIFLPFIVLLEDFGIHLQILDELFPEPDNEMPVMPVMAVAGTMTQQQAMEETA